MLNKLRETGRLNSTILLFILGFFSFVLFLSRFIYTGSFEFLFLNWNLFLAFIPWLITSVIILKELQNKKIILFFMIISWLLFFPNSPYILTDLIHLGMSTKAPLWYDLILILSFAWTGLLFGFISLMDIEKVLENFLGRGKTIFLIISFLFISGFGVYIGRYLRWNTWDVVVSPFALLTDIFTSVTHPASFSRAWGLTLFIGIFLNLIYFSLKFLKSAEKDKIFN